MKQKIQIVLAVAMLIAAIRVAWIFYERHEENAQPAKTSAPALNPDYYVTPKKLYPYDLKSAKQLTKLPVWVKVGYYYPFYPYEPATRHADLTHEAGKLLPIQKLEIKDVVTQASPTHAGERAVLATFDQNGQHYAAPIGTERNGDYKLYSDDMLFIEDPHQLYKHWPADAWHAIDDHQVKPGMSELQASFALGIGLLETGGDDIDRTLDYPNGGNPIKVSFHDGKAAEVKAGKM